MRIFEKIKWKMKNTTKLYLIPGVFFLLAAAVDLTSHLAGWNAHDTVKGALMSLLCATTIAYALPRKPDVKLLGILVWAQLAGLTGDLLLQGSGFVLFVSGMTAFLAGHVLYISLMGRHSWKGLGWKVWVPALAVMAALSYGLIRTIGVSGALFWPMIVYGLVLLLLVFSALCGVVRLGGSVWWILLTAALFFIGSDSLIAIRKFGGPNTGLMAFAVMGTYLAAQTLLAVGCLNLICKSKK